MKPSSKVRATFQASVLEGTVLPCVDPGVVVLDIGEKSQVRYLLKSDGWQFREVQPAEPLVGSVVLDLENDAWQRKDDGWYMAAGDDPFTWSELNSKFGPVSVIYDAEEREPDCACC